MIPMSFTYRSAEPGPLPRISVASTLDVAEVAAAVRHVSCQDRGTRQVVS